jgi:hypothetical protein
MQTFIFQRTTLPNCLSFEGYINLTFLLGCFLLYQALAEGLITNKEQDWKGVLFGVHYQSESILNDTSLLH